MYFFWFETELMDKIQLDQKGTLWKKDFKKLKFMEFNLICIAQKYEYLGMTHDISY